MNKKKYGMIETSQDRLAARTADCPLVDYGHDAELYAEDLKNIAGGLDFINVNNEDFLQQLANCWTTGD
jgi:hypothetical protein